MHRMLGDSLEHICSAAQGLIPFDGDAMRRLYEALRQGMSARPKAFADYYDLVPALEMGQDDEAIRLFGELAQATPAAPELEILALNDPALGSDQERFTQMMNSDPTVDLGFLPPPPEVYGPFVERLTAGLALLDQALPDLSGEIRAIIRQVIVITGDSSKAYDVDGGSHYQLWGAVFLNGLHHPNRVAVAEVLAHECAHSLLFGFCTDTTLVENEDDELFSSPLRVDPRPMDGIYHATFVSARMHWAMTRLAADPSLSAEERRQAHDAAAADRDNFYAGEGIVAEHARLTDLGRALMHEARAYMAAAS